jgi:heat shock protein 5
MEDAMSKKKVEAINGLTSFVYSVKGQVTDPDGWSKKVRYETEWLLSTLNAVHQMGDRDKESMQEALRTATEWMDRHSEGATLEEVEDQLASKFSISHLRETSDSIVDLKSIVNTITAKLYEDSNPPHNGRDESEL